MTVFKTARGRAAPVGREEMDVRSRRVSSTHDWMGRCSRSEIYSNGVVEDWVGTTRSGVVGLVLAVLTNTAAFLFVSPAAGLMAAVNFGLGGHFGQRGRFRERLMRGFRIWWSSGGGIANTPASDVIPVLAQIRLIRRGTGPLGFSSTGVDCGGAL
jgi:hypothetical protein